MNFHTLKSEKTNCGRSGRIVKIGHLCEAEPGLDVDFSDSQDGVVTVKTLMGTKVVR